jgi:hypothetical protein
LTAATESVFIGYNTKSKNASSTNEIVIGANAEGSGDNTVTIGHTSIIATILRGTVNMANLPTSSAGLATGDLWNNSGIVNII